MALNEIRIVVVNGGGSACGGGTAKIKTPEQVEREATKMRNKKLAAHIKAFTNPIDAATDKIAGKMSPSAAMATTMSVQIGKQIALQATNYFVSDIGRKNGDSNYQAIINRNMEIVNDYLNVGTSAASGAMTGAMVGGPIGAAVGAVLGGISAGINIGFRQAERERKYAHEMFLDSRSQMAQLSRANYSALTGRK